MRCPTCSTPMRLRPDHGRPGRVVLTCPACTERKVAARQAWLRETTEVALSDVERIPWHILLDPAWETHRPAQRRDLIRRILADLPSA